VDHSGLCSTTNVETAIVELDSHVFAQMIAQTHVLILNVAHAQEDLHSVMHVISLETLFWIWFLEDVNAWLDSAASLIMMHVDLMESNLVLVY
jgi:hypothetical protein